MLFMTYSMSEEVSKTQVWHSGALLDLHVPLLPESHYLSFYVGKCNVGKCELFS